MSSDANPVNNHTTQMSLRERLRELPSIVGRAPNRFDAGLDNPALLLIDWITAAIDAEIPEPHAVTLSTVDVDGHPDARVLILNDIHVDGRLEIATAEHSPKAQQLSQSPHVAVSWYCSSFARAIRVRGIASLASPDTAANDFKSRSRRAKAIALAGKQSSSLSPETDRAALIDLKERGLSDDETSPHWQVWQISPSTIEFWQGAVDRNHDRLQYIRTEDGWTRSMLWP